jgi:hypothetical protein
VKPAARAASTTWPKLVALVVKLRTSMSPPEQVTL